jgi:hypothetical protein
MVISENDCYQSVPTVLPLCHYEETLTTKLMNSLVSENYRFSMTDCFVAAPRGTKAGENPSESPRFSYGAGPDLHTGQAPIYIRGRPLYKGRPIDRIIRLWLMAIFEIV